MFLKASKRHLVVLAVVLTLTVIAGILIVICPPGLYPDPGAGFQVMRSMMMGGGFNLSITPSQANILQNTTTFLTWWSPGQYLLPYGFKVGLGVNMGQSAALTVLFCDVLGIFGFYNFFRKVGFSHIVAALSVGVIASQQFYVIPYVFYNGGETLLFGFLGWYLYGCFSFGKINWQLITFVLLTGWIGFFCKSAFLWMYASGLFCLWFNLSSNKMQLWNWIKNGIVLAIPAAISLLVISKLYLSRGGNPASQSPGFRFSLEALAFPLGSPLLSGFSVDELSHGLINHQDPPIFNATQSMVVLLLTALLSIALFAAILRFVPHRKYKVAVCGFYGMAVLFFVYVFLKQLNISYEARHFRIVGLLFIPGALYLIMQLKPVFKYAFLLLWIAVGFTTVKFFIYGYKYNSQVSAHGPSGFSQEFIDRPALNYLQQLDKNAPKDALFVFTSIDIGLDIINHRIIWLESPEDIDSDTYIADNQFNGNTGPLYILLPAVFEKNGKAEAFKQCFPQYSNFSIKKLSKDYILLSGY
ncbi:hypothetical protein BDD43_5246 [Mucilaginibacter gracilis]|uniref:Glycosyltransferase RgtA/B/C/D-like domain-containing protein n=1 Tax=Mucilaginibacter gracilis TaxID=423350 RepID=A0A495J8B4_9SPHI|nr:hypothetical protein [Mucilaginibacter gracilis]RKR84991.1 hypothetical protein BDD43_5246 [Mucilaginibacter gracilis]